MLQPFVRMGYFPLQGYLDCKECFRLFNFPDTKPCILVDIMLIKQRHFYLNRFSLQPPKNNRIGAGFYSLFTEYLLQYDLLYK